MSTMMQNFVFPGMSARTVFGSGTVNRVPEEVALLGGSRIMVLSTGSQADVAAQISHNLGTRAVGQFGGAVMHTPVEVTAIALEAFNACDADCIVAVGGGSAIGLSKALATRTGADQIVIPTTYSGSEMTDILGETDAGIKKTRRDASIRPETVIYDADLTLPLPVALTMKSALNAIAHAVEALYARERNPIINLMAGEALRAFAEGLPVLKDMPNDAAARSQVFYATWLCSSALGYVSMALHHKLAHTIGGSFNLPHADTHAILLPHTTAFNAQAVPELLRPVADVFGEKPGAGLWDFAQKIGAPIRLKDLGLNAGDLDEAAQIATQNAYSNPRDFDRDDIRDLLQAAWEGTRPNH